MSRYRLCRAGRGEVYGAAGDRLLFEEKAGLVPVEVLSAGGEISGARLTAPQPLSRGDEIAVETIAESVLDRGRRH